MGTPIPSDLQQQLVTANNTAIADLGPEISEPTSRTVRGVVTITWPYSSVKGTFAFILAEPDYRLRLNKGQARINLSGPSAKAAAESELSGGDEVLISLDGAEWEPEETNRRQSLLATSIDWQLKFSNKLLLQVTLAETRDTKLVAVDQRTPLIEPQPQATTPPAETSYVDDIPTPRLEAFTPPSKTQLAKIKDGEFESPAFIKRARVSYGSLFEDGYDIFEDDGGVVGKGRKRTRFGRESGAWKFSSQSPSPEPASLQIPTSSPPRPEMTDEGCQTTEIDFPMAMSAQSGENFQESQPNQKSIPEEHVTRPGQGMVDQGVQGDFHNDWSTATHTPPQSFDSIARFPDDGSELHVLQPHDQFNAITNDSQRGWEPMPVDLGPENYSHNIGPPPDAFHEYTGESAPAPESHLMSNASHSPSGPNNLPIEHVEHGLEHDVPTDEQEYPMHDIPETTAYPPLDLEEAQTTPYPQRANLDYPSSFLDNSNVFPQENMDVDRRTFGADVPAAADAASSLWTTINNAPQATSMSHTSRSPSAEGVSPDAAVVINESDSDDDPPPPAAVEDIVTEGHGDDLDMYDAEDEVDAGFSDDDEPEYDADEMGGDYDTRVYEAPDDDEDDSHDEDLRSHELEPEFDDGGSWGGEEEEEENIDEYESEYEMDDEQPSRPPRPPIQSTPQVIDLISSSEDESDNDEAPPSPPPSHSQQSVAPQNMPSITSDRSAENESEGDKEEEDEEDGEAEEDEDEDESEEDEKQNDAESNHLSDTSDSELSTNEAKIAHRALEAQKIMAGSPGDEEIPVATELDPQPEPTTPRSFHTNDLSIKQERSDLPLSQPSEADYITQKEADNGNTMEDVEMEEVDAANPQSAAEGLEILSRVVDNESKVNDRAVSLEKSQGEVAAALIPEGTSEPLTDHAQWPEEKVGQESQDVEDDESVDMVSTMPDAALSLQPVESDESNQVESAIPLSPQTHSIITHPADEEITNAISQETIFGTETLKPADQLPTPRDTQLMGHTATISPVAAIEMELDEPDQASDSPEPIETIAHEVSTVTDQLADVKQSSTLIKDTAITEIQELSVESNAFSEQQIPEQNPTDLAEPVELPVSPTLSFQTQVDADDLVQSSPIKSTPRAMIKTVIGEQTFSDTEVDVSGVSLSFVSQMEVDDELQASILEYSQDFDDEARSETTEKPEMIDRPESRDDEDDLSQGEDEAETDHESQHLASRGPSPELGTDIQHGDETDQASSIISQADSDSLEQVSQIDPSVLLARAANTSQHEARHHDMSNDFSIVEKSIIADRGSPSSDVEDPGVQLARASINKPRQAEEESNSMTAAKLELVRYLRDELHDCTPLKILRQHRDKKLDVIAVAMMKPADPQRAKGGPREYMMSFTITDHSISPFSVVEVQLYRPHKETLPIVKAGDVVLLRNFTVVSLPKKEFGLRTNDESSWAVFDREDEPAQIKGPPVEYSDKEIDYVARMRTWFGLLDEKARTRLRRANDKIIDAGKSK
ncbi:hypothetical protein M426DRAFT_8442 [Hypoxylon sp. CI-4A]|nr:hypothetical protein M426DRAFT_8442 [Hypoxylon sp. CI-4A]